MLNERWTACLKQLQTLVEAPVYQTWVPPLRPLSYKPEEKELHVGVPSKSYVQIMGQNMGAAFISAVQQTFGADTKVRWRVLEAQPETPAPASSPTTPATAAPYSPQQTPAPQTLDSRLNPNYDFSTYCEGASNKVALIAGKAIAQVPGQNTFNPFFLYGPSGVGKTHLVNAIGLGIKERHPEKRVLFVSAQEFLTQYVEATSVRNKGNEFFLFYQSIEVLIIDDLHVIESKRGTERAFFHIFNHLLQLNRQIIITCDRAPSQFQGLEERMLNRFKMGLVEKIDRPDLALRRLFLTTNLQKANISLPEEVQQYIIDNVSGSMRELQGTLNTMLLHAVCRDHCDLDLDLAREVVSRIVVEEVQRTLSFELILPAVCAHYKVKESDVKSKSRKSQHTMARQLIMYLTQLHTKASLSQIGRYLGGRDHSTVSHACKLIEKRLNIEPQFRLEVEHIEQQLLKGSDQPNSNSRNPRA